MKWKFEEEFRRDKPETVGETDSHFDLDNYKDWLEAKLTEARSSRVVSKEVLLDISKSFREWQVKWDLYGNNKTKIKPNDFDDFLSGLAKKYGINDEPNKQKKIPQCNHEYSDGTGTGWNVCKKCGDMY